jgi:hypothetical protein
LIATFDACNQRVLKIVEAFNAEGIDMSACRSELAAAVQSLHIIGSRSLMIDPNNDIVHDALASVDQQFKDLLDTVNASPRLREILWSVVEEAKQ